VTTPGWDALTAALAAHRAQRVATSGRRAAVALVLRDDEHGRPELLFIRRAEHEKDPWSGHMGFPGGRAERGDANLAATAVRETLEETGIDLARDATRLGDLDEVRALARGRPVDLVIAPFVFRLSRRVDGTPSHEVVSVHWIALDRLLDPASRSVLQHEHEKTRLELPCFRIDGLVVWGLTYRMFENLVFVLASHASGSGSASGSAE
jgi:8-oxo-dGTP pyrophosphatase MutT (NUDIX family)